MAPTTTQKRHPRYQRTQEVSFRLQDRDIEIIRAVHQYRFLNSAHIKALIPGSDQRIIRRLNTLFHAGYLDRPKSQRQIRNEKMVYALGNKGADLLAGQLDLELPATDWTSKNRELGMAYLEHTLMIANFIIMIKLACAEFDGLTFIEPETIINHRPQYAKENEPETGWRVEVQGEKGKYSMGIVPDYVFGIYDEGAGRTFYYFLEADRSTMPIKRKDFRKSSFYKKLVGYYETFQQGYFPTFWGFKAPRILTLTVSKARLSSMIEANQALTDRGSKMFLFAQEDLFNLGDPAQVFNRHWIDGEGRKVSLLDSKNRHAIINEHGELTFFSAG